jgi:glycosyltransferase involved in cell wall biosynthesis
MTTTATSAAAIPTTYPVPNQGVFGWSFGTGGVHFHRIGEPLRVLRFRGANVATGPQLDDETCARYDTIVVHLLHHERQSEAWAKLAAKGRHRLVLDVDDAMWAPDWQPFRNSYRPDVLERLYRNVQLAHVITTPSYEIADHLMKWNKNVWILPNTVPEMLVKQPARYRGNPIIGYQGSISHVTDLDEEFARDIGAFMAHYSTWHLRVWGDIEMKDTQNRYQNRFQKVPWNPDVRSYYRTLSMDIGLGPLKDTPFNRAKSALRALEYQAAGIVPVLSDVRCYHGWIDQGETGYLIEQGTSWFDVLSHLASDSARRRRMALNGRLFAAKWTTEARAHEWVDAWDSV